MYVYIYIYIYVYGSRKMIRYNGAIEKSAARAPGQVRLWDGLESRLFHVSRGVRQGDPLSPLLFNLVMADVLREVSVIWQRRGYGTNVGQKWDGTRLTHIAFADDMTIIARSWLSLKRMVSTLRTALRTRGLQLHPTKCKAQANVANIRRGKIRIEDDLHLDILDEGQGLTILGTVIALSDATKCEIDNRIATGWRKFWSLKRLLLNDKVSIKKRFKLFDTTVGSCVLWCSESWTPRAEELRQLRAARHAMLRRIAGRKRAPEESWVDWIKRSTDYARGLAQQTRIRDWAISHAKSKWAWAGHVARRSADTWLYSVTAWRDAEWSRICEMNGYTRPLRPSRRRWMKWEDSL